MVERICSNCNCSNLRRSSRQGFVERFVYSLFGLYPWRCRQCCMRSMLRDRGEQSRPHASVHATGKPA